MDEIELKRRIKTTLLAGRASTWTEIELATKEAGVIAVFRPSDEEIEQGEADLSVEHLVAQAERLRAEVLRLRRAFRSAREVSLPPRVLRPLYGQVWSDDGSVYRRPSIARGGVFVVAGAVVGILSDVASANTILTATLSVTLMIYGGIGLVGLGSADAQIERSRGLPVPIQVGLGRRLPPVDAAREFHGPYSAHPLLSVHETGRDYLVEPSVEVRDANEQVVWRRSGHQYGVAGAEEAAVIMLREADQLIAELTQRQEDVARPQRFPREWPDE